MKKLDKIENYFIDEFHLDKNFDYPIKDISAKDLITSNRIDLIAKIKLIDSIVNGYDSNFLRNLYRATIECFSDGTFVEPGKESKNSFDKYLTSFIELISNIKTNGFDDNISIVPISDDYTLIDGAHRTSICAYFDKMIKTIVLPVSPNIYDLTYFKNKRLDDYYLDYLCLEYSKIKNDVHAICLWPSSTIETQNQMEKIIFDNFKVVYKKEVDFSYNGLKNFMTQIYGNFDWIGNIDNKFKGVFAKLDKCYSENNKTIIYVIEEKSNDKILKIKARIRDEIGIGNHSIHSTDNYDETIQLLKMVLNENTINFLNAANPYKFKDFYISLDKFKNDMKKLDISLDDVLIDGSSILSAYGLRDNNDIDVFIDEKRIDDISNLYDVHNNELDFYKQNLSDILYDPRNFIYFNDIKFISLQLLREKKKNRNEKKDRDDIILIDSVFVKPNFLKLYKIKITKKIIYLNVKIKNFLKFILKKLGLFDILKRIIKGV